MGSHRTGSFKLLACPKDPGLVGVSGNKSRSFMSLAIPHLIVQPDDGVTPVREFLRTAQQSLLIKQFTFTEPSLIQTVIDRKNSGVAVRVMLNSKRSGGDRANDEAFEALEKAGVNVRWANPKFYVTHEKSIVIDNQVALIATFNLCEKYFSLTRDYGVIVFDPDKVVQIAAGFDAEFSVPSSLTAAACPVPLPVVKMPGAALTTCDGRPATFTPSTTTLMSVREFGARSVGANALIWPVPV